MRRVITALGADYEQWRALTRVGIKLDLRQQHLGLHATRKQKKGIALPPQLLIYLFTSFIFAAMLGLVADLFLGVTLLISYAMFMTAVTVLLEYHTVVTAPDDYFVLGFQPIASRTYFAARVTNLLLFVLATTSALAIGPATVAMFRGHVRPEVGVALYVALCLAACATALLMVLLYGWLVARVPARRLKSALTYLQLIVSFIVYGGYALLPQVMDNFGVARMQLPRTWKLMLFPPAWYASIVELALGHADARTALGALLGIGLLAVAARAAAGRISLEFSEKLSALSVVSAAPVRRAATRGRFHWGLGEGEARAVWLLIRGQFRSDNKFRLGVLAILPLTLLYLLMAMASGSIQDPFVAGAHSIGNTGPVYVVMIMFPVMLMTSITSSDQYKAAWIFFATPADRHLTLMAMRKAVFIAFVLPYLAFMSVIFVFWFHNVLHAAVHVLLLALISNLALVLLLVVDPRLPFSRPRIKGERTTRMFGVVMAAAAGSALAIPLAARYVYISATRTGALLGTLWLLAILLERVGRMRVRRQVLESEFTG